MTAKRRFCMSIVVGLMLVGRLSQAQVLTGALSGTVNDESGGVLIGVSVPVMSPALIGGISSTVTNERGQFRFVSLPAGEYALAVELANFDAYRKEHIPIDVQASVERTIILKVGAIGESISVQAGSIVDPQRTAFASRFGLQALTAIPFRRFSMFDLIRATPGVSPTSASSGADPSVSVFGSSVNRESIPAGRHQLHVPMLGRSAAAARTFKSTAEERLADDNLFSQNFGRGSVFVDPRRAMLGVRFSFPQ
jgi:hypothetical protein